MRRTRPRRARPLQVVQFLQRRSGSGSRPRLELRGAPRPRRPARLGLAAPRLSGRLGVGRGLGLSRRLGLRVGSVRGRLGLRSRLAARAAGSGSAAGAAARRRRLAAHQPLVGDRLQLDRESRDQRVQRPHQTRDRRRDRADELGVEHLARGQARDRTHLVGAERGAVHQPALELEDVQCARGVVERLGRERGVAPTSASAVGPSSIGFSASAPALSAARSDREFLTIRNFVSDSRSARAARPPGRPRCPDSRPRRSPRRPDLARDLLDDCCFLVSVHGPLQKQRPRRGGRRTEHRCRLSIEAPPAPDLRGAPPEVSGIAL